MSRRCVWLKRCACLGLSILTVACSGGDDAVTDVITGSMAVTVAGLPAGTSASVTVAGPGFSRSVTATQTLSGLDPGNYSVTADIVADGDTRYAPTPVTQVVTVVGGAAASAAVTYALATGSLTIVVTGLPPGASGAITVSGPGSYAQSLTGTTTLVSLAPGAYTINAANVSSGTATHVAAPTTQVATVAAGATTTASVAYSDQHLPLRLALAQVATGLSKPLQLVAPPSDPRLFVVEQTGRIRIIRDGQVLAQPFLDVSARLLQPTGSGEHGLLGLAFHPQYATNRTFFIHYVDAMQDVVVERYQVSANPDVAESAGTVILRVNHRLHTNHNGGALAFGPDGFLYVGLGDGGGSGDPQGNAQDLNSLLGKVLRIDVNTAPYGVPPTNPFVGQAGRRGEIWAYGLRNPWRIDVDAATAMLYIADVGQNNVEEVDAVPLSTAGLNFGWNLMEGTRCYQPACSPQGLTLPVVEYLHNEGCSVTGGFVYRGAQVPEVQGHYFYSDYCRGFLRSFLLQGGVATQQRDWNISSPGNVTSFGRDAAGELYVLTQGGGVFKIVRQ